MSLIVSSGTAALQAAPSANKAGSSANAQQPDADHFGKVLDRSLAGSDKSADNAANSAKPADRPAARRPANGSANTGQDSGHQQDPVAVPALAFLALPPTSAKAIEVNAQSGSDSQPQSAAEIRLNAAIAAAGSKSGAPAATTIADAETGDKSTPLAEAALPAAGQLAAHASPAGATSSKQSGLASQEPGSGEYTTLTQNPQQTINQMAAGGAAGQQAAHDDGKHEKLGKPGRQDSQTAAKVDAGKTDVAAAASVNGVTAAKAAAGNSGQPNLDMTAQINPAMAHAQTTAATASSAPPQVKLALSPVVGSDGWGTALGKQVIWMGNTNNQSAELHLNPPDLGPLKVTLTINDNQAQAMFVSAHQSVRAALEAALPQLRNSLAESGINLGNTSVSADAQQPQQRQQSAFAQSQSGHRGSNHQSQAGMAAGELSGNVGRSAVPVSRNGNGKVDIFA
ncbi:flagellar hook-length control protein FliK [Collimonas sp. OK607]|uniref:flagellar hook-length control protein FliK n=1 Tax=Collimonas sp. OK607 TaxID=1798194 RepID=UPI0008E6E72D|nr:flagellar hook-length control protein FliK [Collimonas sp. OK607]SFB22348.1 flagellar hook-length control protein FliK [Collimonas sp. OK607]